MPGYTIHLAIAKKHFEKNDIKNQNEFLKGAISPDLLDKSISHYGESSSSPDFNKFLETNSLDSEYNQGYFLHLITDYLFYNKFLKKFSNEIYRDYDKLNEFLINKYNLEIPSEIKSIVKFGQGEPKILNRESICKFIEVVASIDIKKIKEYEDSLKEYDNKSKEEAER